MFNKSMTKRFSVLKWLGVVLVAGVVAASCDTSKLNDALDNFDVVIGLDPINTSASGQFVDAKTGELIEQPVTVTFKGQNGDDVIDMYSKPLDQQEVDGGLVSFGITNSVSPSQSSPAEITVVAESQGYIGTGHDVTITSEGQTSFTIYMVDRDNPPEGSRLQSETEGEANNGEVSEDITVSSGTEAESNSSSSVNVPQGTVIKDAEGNNLNGQLRTTVGYYNNTSDRSMKSFPGGFTSADGEDLVSAGYSSIEIEDSNGNKAKTFSQSMKLNTEVPGGMINPKTGEQVKAGDEITVYSYDTDNAQWAAEGSATLKGPNEKGNYYVEYEADHLSYWGIFFPGVPTCSSGATVTINRNGNTGPLNATVSAEGFSKSLTIPAGVSSISVPGDLGLNSIPALDATLSITVESGTETETGNLCNGSYSINLPQPPADLVDVTVEAQLQCPNSNEYIRVTDIPTSTVKYRKSNAPAGTSWNTAGNLEWNFDEENQRLTGGSFDVDGVVDGSDYDFKIYYDGDTYSREGITLTAPTTSYTEEVTNDVCS